MAGFVERVAAWGRHWPALLLTGLVACGGGGGGGSDGGGTGGDGSTFTADLCPMATGDTRTWRVVSGTGLGTELSERFGAQTAVGGFNAFEIRDSDGYVEYRARSATGVVTIPAAGQGDLTAAIGSVETLRFGLVAGQSVVTYERSFNADTDGDGRAEPVSMRVELSYLGRETVQTVLASYANAARLRTVASINVRTTAGDFNFSTTTDEWFAAGIGPVRVSTVTDTTGRPRETVVEELVAYGVGPLRSENVAPRVVQTTPAAGGYAQPGAAARVRFSERVDPQTLDSANGLRLLGPQGQVVAARLESAAGGTEFTLVPLAPLADGPYTLRLGAGIVDFANNPLAAADVAFTVDAVGPGLVASLPAQGETEAPLSFTPSLTFDEDLRLATGNTVAFELIDEASSVAVMLPAQLLGRTVTALAPVALQHNRAYRLELRGSLFDAAGNPLRLGGSVAFRSDPGPLARPAALEPNVQVTAVTLADFDGDGRPDLLYAGARPGEAPSVAFRAALAAGGFGAAQRLFTATGCTAVRLVVGDVDGDGRRDIAISGCFGPQRVWRQTSAGQFEVELLPASAGPLYAAVDLDGDGRDELLTSRGTVGNTTVAFLGRDTAGVWAEVLGVSGGGDEVADATLADLDGDGQLDLVWANFSYQGSSQLGWALRAGSGFGSPQRRTLGFSPLYQAGRLVVGDVNADGRADAVILANRFSEGLLIVATQDAAGDFGAIQTHATAFGAYDLALGDMDADGRLDVVVVHTSLRTVGVYLQAASGTLQAERQYEGGADSYEDRDSLVLVDLNGDQRLDVVALSSTLLGRGFSGAWPVAANPGRGAALGELARRGRAQRWRLRGTN